MTAPVSVVWFRRDLRLHDQPALVAAAAGQRCAPLFVLDDALLRAGSPNRTWFMLMALEELDAGLAALGSRLHVRRGRPEEVVPAFAAETGAGAVHVSRDHAPYGRRRDRRVAERLAADGVEFVYHPGNLVHEPEQVGRDGGRPLAVFGAFLRAWLEADARTPLDVPPALPPTPDGCPPGRIPTAGEVGLEPTADASRLPVPGEAAARDRLRRWLAGPLDRYAERRDRLDDPAGTSRLSADLRFGLLSPTEVALLAAGSGEGRRRFRSELAWREFYAHLLWHEPRFARHSVRAELDSVGGPDGPAADAWREGRTGYPVVDAAMRELQATGWLHNRARMVAASFLTKHLLVDWRIGEAHFRAHLVDGDLASNVGGWQWAASVGTDPQPYFRIFNPMLQGARFDPDGTWVRRLVPELADVPGRHVHAPWTMPVAVQAAARCVVGRDYPAPIVEHGQARSRALDAYRAMRRTS